MLPNGSQCRAVGQVVPQIIPIAQLGELHKQTSFLVLYFLKSHFLHDPVLSDTRHFRYLQQSRKRNAQRTASASVRIIATHKT